MSDFESFICVFHKRAYLMPLGAASLLIFDFSLGVKSLKFYRDQTPVGIRCLKEGVPVVGLKILQAFSALLEIKK